MKNIHVLPTDKEPVKGDLLLRHIWKDTSNECISWWRYDDTITIDGVVQYTTLNGSFRDITSSFKFQNIYITSDEEIKEGNFFLGANNVVYKFTSDDVKNGFKPKGKKIILTTDQDLIKDGVQAIDDEFLEWFVKNPTCEYVDVKEKQHFEADKSKRQNPLNGVYYSYKIIIPKEWFEQFKNK